MEKGFYISLVASLTVTLLGYFSGYFSELTLVFFPFLAFIYMAFNFDMDRLNFNLIWLILVFPFVFFYVNDISFMAFGIVYQFIYLLILILFNIQKGKSENKNSIKELPKEKLIVFFIKRILVGIGIFVILLSLLLFSFGQ